MYKGEENTVNITIYTVTLEIPTQKIYEIPYWVQHLLLSSQ